MKDRYNKILELLTKEKKIEVNEIISNTWGIQCHYP